jgi:hypothetical protein
MSQSLAGTLGERRKELVEMRQKTLVLPVPGYEGLLFARYRPLPYEDLRRIQLRHEGIGKDPHVEVNAAADMLIEACEDLLVPVAGAPEGEYESLGKTWTPAAVRELFEIDLADGVTTRSAFKAAMADDSTRIMEHYGRFMIEAAALYEVVNEEMAGELPPSEEG